MRAAPRTHPKRVLALVAAALLSAWPALGPAGAGQAWVFRAAEAAGPSGVAGEVYQFRTTARIGPGVEHVQIRQLLLSGWVEAQAIVVDLGEPGVEVDVLLADGQHLTARAPLSRMAERSGALAAINGDFFLTGASGAPVGLTIAGGRLLKSPVTDLAGRPSLAVVAPEPGSRAAQVGFWRWTGWAVPPKGEPLELDGWNEPRPQPGQVVAYDASWGTAALPLTSNRFADGETAYAVARRAGAPDVLGPGLGEVWRVLELGPGVPAPPQEPDTLVLLGWRQGAGRLRARLAAGDSFTLRSQLVPARVGPVEPQAAGSMRGDSVREQPLPPAGSPAEPSAEPLAAISGGPLLLWDGVTYAQPFSTSIAGLHPRTAAGVSADGRKLYLVVVDGRSQASRGMELEELAQLLRSLGASYAINLDGGGSSQLVVRGPLDPRPRIANRPSDGRERAIPVALAVLPSARSAAAAEVAGDPETAPFPPPGPAQVVAVQAPTPELAGQVLTAAGTASTPGLLPAGLADGDAAASSLAGLTGELRVASGTRVTLAAVGLGADAAWQPQEEDRLLWSVEPETLGRFAGPGVLVGGEPGSGAVVTRLVSAEGLLIAEGRTPLRVLGAPAYLEARVRPEGGLAVIARDAAGFGAPVDPVNLEWEQAPDGARVVHLGELRLPLPGELPATGEAAGALDDVVTARADLAALADLGRFDVQGPYGVVARSQAPYDSANRPEGSETLAEPTVQFVALGGTRIDGSSPYNRSSRLTRWTLDEVGWLLPNASAVVLAGGLLRQEAAGASTASTIDAQYAARLLSRFDGDRLFAAGGPESRSIGAFWPGAPGAGNPFSSGSRTLRLGPALVLAPDTQADDLRWLLWLRDALGQALREGVPAVFILPGSLENLQALQQEVFHRIVADAAAEGAQAGTALWVLQGGGEGFESRMVDGVRYLRTAGISLTTELSGEPAPGPPAAQGRFPHYVVFSVDPEGAVTYQVYPLVAEIQLEAPAGLRVGEEVQLRAFGLAPADGGPYELRHPAQVRWELLTPSVGTLDPETGRFRARAPGTAVVLLRTAGMVTQATFAVEP